jgi:ABC-type nitrate/sulfonate/bicarbonate transport system ATPase subunit
VGAAGTEGETTVAGLDLEQLAVPGAPATIVVQRGEQRAVVVTEPAVARRLADAVIELAGVPVRLVPAEGGLLPHLSVEGNLAHAYRARGLPRRDARAEAHGTASRCGLGDVLRRYPHEITPGRRRLAGVARALCGRPGAIVLEDAPGLPTWAVLLDLANVAEHLPDLLSAAVLLIAPDQARAAGFSDLVRADA